MNKQHCKIAKKRIFSYCNQSVVYFNLNDVLYCYSLRFMISDNLYIMFLSDDTESVKPPKRGFIQSIFCCWRRPRTKSGQNGLPAFSGSQNASSLQGGRIRHLLPPVRHQDMHKKCMVIDLDETLVHSSFKVRKSPQLYEKCSFCRQHNNILFFFFFFIVLLSNCITVKLL